jgi:hypothetical protein
MHSDSLRYLNGRGGEITAQDHLPKSAPGLRQPRDETRHGNRNLPLEINLITIPLVGRAHRRSTGHQRDQANGGGNVTRPRAADDFATIRARMEDLRRERERAHASDSDLLSDPPVGRGRTDRWTPGGISATAGRVRQSG